MGGPAPLRQFIDLARPQHPSLVDEAHHLDALFGVTNIPQNIWIDETGIIVRPPEPGSPAPVYVETDDPTYAMVMHYMHERREDPGSYSDRIRDWASKGADSVGVDSKGKIGFGFGPIYRGVGCRVYHDVRPNIGDRLGELVRAISCPFARLRSTPQHLRYFAARFPVRGFGQPFLWQRAPWRHDSERDRCSV